MSRGQHLGAPGKLDCAPWPRVQRSAWVRGRDATFLVLAALLVFQTVQGEATDRTEAQGWEQEREGWRERAMVPGATVV